MRVLALLLLFAVPSWGGIRPSFWLDDVAWRATHIVVATEGKSIDGKLTVVESVAGDLKPGTALELPGLAKFEEERARTIHKHFRATSKRVGGQRMLLFLIRTIGGFKAAAQYGGMEVSAAWVEGENVYALQQLINPGPQLMSEVGTERAMLARIGVVRSERKKLDAAIALPDPAKRAEAVASRIDSPVQIATGAAVSALGDCGAGAMPVIKRLLADPKRLPLHGNLVRELVRAGGEDAAPHLVSLLKRDLHFWTETGPALSKGWWNGKDIEAKWRAILQQRYSCTLETLRGLKALKHRAAAPTAKRFADFWRSLPQLHDKSGLDQMTKAAEAVANLPG
ncbi:MAG: hypothetical protein ACYTGZ_16640 [Planctomycetota bacterium]|jgi:hypothetical protein